MSFVEVAIVKMENEKKYLFEAPRFSVLKEGDKVICDTSTGDREGTLVATYTATSEELAFLGKLEGVTMPLKRIKAKICIKEFDYE